MFKNELTIIENIKRGLESEHIDHIQGFPDSVCSELRGGYRLLYNSIKHDHIDPMNKAATILSVIAITGNLITVTYNGYCCNNGFIDSFGTFYHSENAVLENLKIMASDYCNDGYFVDKAIDYFYHFNDEVAVSRLRDYRSLIHLSLAICQNTEERNPLCYAEKVMNLLSKPISEKDMVESTPTAWDSETWLKEFLPIWERRVRWEQHSFRAKYYKQHIAIVEVGCYISQSGKEVHIPWDAYTMMKSSKMYSSEIDVSPLKTTFENQYEVWQMDCLEAAHKIQNG